MKPVRLLCYMFVLAFLDLTPHNSIPIILSLLTIRNVALIYYCVTIFEKQKKQKTKDCARSGSFQLQHRCFQLWCLPALITCVLY